jgi:hypothetical protein
MNDNKNMSNLDIPGYVHPVNTNTNRDRRYKTFNENDKKIKKDMNNFNSINIGFNYSKICLDSINDELICPKCKEKATKTCNCIYNDKTCNNGHTWFTDRDGKIINGSPHKKE